MIVYRKGISLRVLLRVSGSVMPSAALTALGSALLTIFFEYSLPKSYLSLIFNHPFPFQPIAHTVAFTLVFRTNVAYNRYWESCTQVAAMSAKWGDCVADATSFDELEKPGAARAADDVGGPSDEEMQRRAHREKRHSQARTLHLASLEHALAIQYLRRDDDLTRLETAEVPPLGVEGCATPRGEVHGMSGVFSSPQYEKQTRAEQLQSEREAPEGAPHANGGAYTSWASHGSMDAEMAPAETGDVPQQMGVVMSEMSARPSGTEASEQVRRKIRNERLLEEQRGSDQTGIAWPALPVLGGVSDTERLQLMRCEDRVAFVHSKLLHHLNMRRKVGGVWADPPVFARVYALLSDGMIAFRQARKIEDVPFPWPYAQMVSFLLFSFALVFPLLVASQMGGDPDEGLSLNMIWLPPVVTFITILAHTGLYRTARVLEDPFVHPPNDLPSVAMQRAFNARLLAHWDALRDTPDDDAPRIATATLGEYARKQLQGPSLEDFNHVHSGLSYYQVNKVDEPSQLLWKLWDERHLSLLYDEVVFLQPAVMPMEGTVQSGYARRMQAKQEQHSSDSFIGWIAEGVRDINEDFKDWSRGLRRRRQPSWLEV